MLRILVEDFRNAVRMLWTSPGVSAIAILTLALGIGANTAIFSLVDVVLFRPLPIARPNQVVRIMEGQSRGSFDRSPLVSFPRYLAYRDHSQVFSGLAAYIDRLPVNLCGAHLSSDRVDAGMVTGNYFQTVGISAYLGRAISPEDDLSGSAPVIMFSYNYWRRHFNLDHSVLGTTFVVDGKQFTLVGIAPRGFGGVSFENLPDVWVPMTHGIQIDPLLRAEIPHRDEAFAPFGVVGRLKSGISLSQAQAELDLTGKQLGAGLPDPLGRNFKRPWPIVVAAETAARGDRRSFSFLVFGIVGLLLFIACADVSGVLLARSESRQRETAIRLALGAPRYRIISLHVAEGLIVAVAGAVFGCLLAAWAAAALASVGTGAIHIPVERAVSVLDLRVLTFVAVIALVAGVISSAGPALHYSQSQLALIIQGDARMFRAGARRISLQSVLVVSQIAISVILLVGAGLLARTLWRLAHVDLGFDAAHTVRGSTDPVRQGYSKPASLALLDPLLDSLRSQPGVQDAAIGPLPFAGWALTVVSIEGHPNTGNQQSWVHLTGVSPGYFSTLGVPVLQGRDFTRADNHDRSGVALINETAARTYWPRQSPVGKHISHVGPRGDSFEIIGVVKDVPRADIRGPALPMVFLPLAQAYLMFPWQPDVNLLARSSGDPHALIPALRNALNAVDQGLPLFHVRTLQEEVDTALAEERFLGRLLLAVACLAIALSMGGVYGLVSYTTQRATRDFGVRMALGAQRSSILWMVLRRGVALSVLGTVAGIALGVLLTKFLTSVLFGVSRLDPLTFSLPGPLMIAATVLACYLPARRATRVDPLLALRSE